ncbi:MAG: hypothetical protein IKM99_05020 [Bacteroidales bacterium]|nr:hypothetical protein [Bacteroidales bacterium]
MLKYDSYYFQCPCCHAWLEGRNLKSELVNEAILYSDGKVLYDNYITTRQKMILCPSCGHVFWVENPTEPFITWDKPEAAVYSWNTWRFFGINFSDNKGKLALIKHYQYFLKKSSYDPKKEIYLRRLLWWAYNDLHRNFQYIRWKYFLNGFMSYGVWSSYRRMLLEGEKLFLKNLKSFNENLNRLLVLLEKHPGEQIDLELPEIYREMRQFDKAKELLDQASSRTHFTNQMLKRSKWKDGRVFMVTG